MLRTLRFVNLTALALVVGMGAIGCDKPASSKPSSATKMDKMGGDKMDKDKMGGDKMDKDKMGGDKMDKDKK